MYWDSFLGFVLDVDVGWKLGCVKSLSRRTVVVVGDCCGAEGDCCEAEGEEDTLTERVGVSVRRR